jgi:hypothetical protein
MTIKEILNQVLNEIGFQEEESFFTSESDEAKQLAALANRELNFLQKYPWQALIKTQTVAMTTDETYPLPTDFRQYVFDTAFTEDRKAWFPISSEKWSYDEARNTISGRSPEVRIIGGELAIRNPANGQTLRLEYVSDAPVLDGDGTTYKSRFEFDTDTFILNDDLLILGVMWRFKKAKGLDFEAELAEARGMLKKEQSTDKNAQTIYFGDGPYYGPHAPYADLYV